MLKVKLILLFILLLGGAGEAFCQQNFTYAQVDSIVSIANKSEKYLNVLDTGQIEQGLLKGRYRDCYIVDSSSNEVIAFISSVTFNNTNNSTVTAYYFCQSQLIKVEIGDVRGGYQKNNITYLYYIKEDRKDYDFQTKELQKLKHLKIAMQYLQNYKQRLSLERKSF